LGSYRRAINQLGPNVTAQMGNRMAKILVEKKSAAQTTAPKSA
jgi:hypothetical protein